MSVEESPQSGLFSESSAPPPPDNSPQAVVAFEDETTGLPQRVGATHPMPVDIGAASVTITAGQVDSSTFTAATTPFAPIGGINDIDIADTPDGEAGVAGMTAGRAVFFNRRDSSKNELGAQHSATPLAHAVGSLASRTSADIAVVDRGSGINIVVTLATKVGTPTFTPQVLGKTASGAYYVLWAASAALAANGTYVYQLAPGAAPNASGITEGKVALLPGTIQVKLLYAGNGTTDVFDTTVDIDLI